MVGEISEENKSDKRIDVLGILPAHVVAFKKILEVLAKLLKIVDKF